jgi:hypothetical protein
VIHTNQTTLLDQAVVDLHAAGTSLTLLIHSDPNVKDLWEAVQNIEMSRAKEIEQAFSAIDQKYQDRLVEAKNELGLMLMMLIPAKE